MKITFLSMKAVQMDIGWLLILWMTLSFVRPFNNRLRLKCSHQAVIVGHDHVNAGLSVLRSCHHVFVCVRFRSGRLSWIAVDDSTYSRFSVGDEVTVTISIDVFGHKDYVVSEPVAPGNSG